MKTKLVTAMMLCSSFVFAEEEKSDTSICKSVSGIAYTIMSTRQKGASMADMMDVSESKLLQTIVIEAYETPKYSVDENQEDAARRFRDRWYLTCIKARQ